MEEAEQRIGKTDLNGGVKTETESQIGRDRYGPRQIYAEPATAQADLVQERHKDTLSFMRRPTGMHAGGGIQKQKC